MRPIRSLSCCRSPRPRADETTETGLRYDAVFIFRKVLRTTVASFSQRLMDLVASCRSSHVDPLAQGARLISGKISKIFEATRFVRRTCHIVESPRGRPAHPIRRVNCVPGRFIQRYWSPDCNLPGMAAHPLMIGWPVIGG